MEMVKLDPIKRSTLTVHEVAIYLGISIDLVYTMVREKSIVHFRIGKRILFKKEAVDRWIEDKMESNYHDE